MAVLFAIIFSAGTAIPQSAVPTVAGQIGRYQIVAGEIGVGPTRRPALIKIDTVTGETWQLTLTYFEAKGKDNSHGRIDVIGWSPVPVSLSAEVKSLQDAGLVPKY